MLQTAVNRGGVFMTRQRLVIATLQTHEPAWLSINQLSTAYEANGGKKHD
jgi:hypothetical protein